MPIVTIYLLDYDLGLSDEAVLDVCPRATARRTGAEIDAGHPFIAGIHHRSHIVQIPRLRGRRRDELERVLSIFDQGEARIERGGAQVLTIDESAYPREYGFVLHQFQRAASESDVRRFMEGEDQLLRDSISWGRQADYERREKGQLLERPFAHVCETGGMRRVHLRDHPNILKRLLVQFAGCNLGLLLRQLIGVGTPRSLQGRAAAVFCALFRWWDGLWGYLRRFTTLSIPISAKPPRHRAITASAHECERGDFHLGLLS